MAVVAIVMSLASCDPMSSVEYKVYNKTADTVTVTMYKEILTSAYKGYTIRKTTASSRITRTTASVLPSWRPNWSGGP